MKYYLGEIYVTHKKTWFGWIGYADKFTTVLIEAESWREAQEKVKLWAEDRMKHLNGKWKYEYFATAPL